MIESFSDFNPDWTTVLCFFLTRLQVIVERLVQSYSNTEMKIMNCKGTTLDWSMEHSTTGF